MFFVYVIWSGKLRKRYVGSSADPEERLHQHNSGVSRFTSRGVPWVLRYLEQYGTRARAMQRERYLKSGAGRVFLDRVMSGQAGYPEAEIPVDCREYRVLDDSSER